MKKASFLVLLALCLSACGFHLRGMIDVPAWLNDISLITEDGDKELAILISSQLEANKIKIIHDPAQAQYWLIIHQSNLRQQIVSIGASTNPRQYQLILTVSFSLQTVKGKIIKATRDVVVTRQLTVNNDRILGSNEEEAILVDEMRRDAAIQILNRILAN